jgi:hypothetical protein
MPIRFSAAFRQLTLDDDAPPDDGAGPLLYARERYADPARPDQNPMAIFLVHPDFELFKQEFVDRIDAVRQFAENHRQQSNDALAPGLPPPALLKILGDLATFETRLFDQQLDFYSTHKDMVYGATKKSFFAVSELIMRDDEKLPLERRLTALRELSPKLIVCPGGQLTGIVDMLDELRTVGDRLAGQIWRRKNQIARQTILDFVAGRHAYPPGNEVHFVNFYANYLADRGEYGLPRQEDPLATQQFTAVAADDLIDCERYAAPHLHPERLAMTLAEQYLDLITDEVRNVTPIDQPIPADKLAEVNSHILALEKTFRGQIAFFDASSFLLTTDYVVYRLAAGPTPMAVDLLMSLRNEGQIEADEPTLLLEKALQVEDDSAPVKLMRWGDLFWVERDDVRDALTPALLGQFSLAEVGAAFGDPADAATALQALVRQVIDNAEGQALLGFPPDWAPHATAVDLLAKLAPADAAQRAETLSALLTAGLDLAARNPRGESPLLLATHLGMADAFALLLDRPDAALDATDIDGWTALGLALRHGHAALADAFIATARDSDRLSDEQKSVLLRPPRNGKLVAARRYAMAQGNGQAIAVDNALVRRAREDGWPPNHEDFVRHIRALDANGLPARLLALQKGFADALRADNELIIYARQAGWLNGAALLALIDALSPDGVPGRAMALQNNHADALRADNDLILHARQAGWLDDAALLELIAAKDDNGVPGRMSVRQDDRADALSADNELIIHARQAGWLDDAAFRELIAAKDDTGVPGRMSALQDDRANALRADNELLIHARQEGWLDDAAFRELIAAKSEDGSPGRMVALQDDRANALRTDNELIIQARQAGWLDVAALRELIAAKGDNGDPGRMFVLQDDRADALHVDNELLIYARQAGWLDDAALRELIAAKDDNGAPSRLLTLRDGYAGALRAGNELIIQARQAGWLNDAALCELIAAKAQNGASARALALQNGHTGALQADNELLIRVGEEGLLPEATFQKLLLDSIQECSLASLIASQSGHHEGGPGA